MWPALEADCLHIVFVYTALKSVIVTNVMYSVCVTILLGSARDLIQAIDKPQDGSVLYISCLEFTDLLCT